ncbi:MAG: hypothetical protein AB1776_02905 [Bacillota bacterium]
MALEVLEERLAGEACTRAAALLYALADAVRAEDEGREAVLSLPA